MSPEKYSVFIFKLLSYLPNIINKLLNRNYRTEENTYSKQVLHIKNRIFRMVNIRRVNLKTLLYKVFGGLKKQHIDYHSEKRYLGSVNK